MLYFIIIYFLNQKICKKLKRKFGVNSRLVSSHEIQDISRRRASYVLEQLDCAVPTARAREWQTSLGIALLHPALLLR